MELPEKMKPFVGRIITMCESQFPRTCSNCGKRFETFREFVSETRAIGAPAHSETSIDEFGLLTYVNCECDSTLTLSCADKNAHEEFNRILAEEALKSGKSKKEILLALRKAVREKVVSRDS